MMGTDKEFVNALYNELFSKSFDQYKMSLNKSLNADTDTYARARNALAKLGDDDRANVINFFKVIIADSASVILGTLDGVHFPDDITGNFSVAYEGHDIQGDLQDIFIERAQNEGVYK